MNRLVVAATVVIALIGSRASAQDSAPKIQVFGGYSLLQVDNGKLTGTVLDTALHEHNSPFSLASNLKGWNAEAQYNANSWFGIAADFGGRYGTPITASHGTTLSGLPKASGYNFMAGPVLTYRNKSRLTPFVHALFGVDRYTLDASTISGLATPAPSTATTYTDFAAALGGGLDLRVIQHVALRLVQLDDYETTHNLNKFYDNAFTPAVFNGLATHERSFRVSAGLTVSF
jgi:opacity protein-like surface antigen